jgi:probable rRNA maturation factor
MTIINNTTYDIKSEILYDIKDVLTKHDLEVLIIDDYEMKQINNQHRNINKSTDVLSFPMEKMGNFKTPLGSIVINIKYIKDMSLKYKHSQEEEMILLFLHGLLHLLGYDHENDTGEMREKEKEIIEKFNLPKSLIIRNYQ